MHTTEWVIPAPCIPGIIPGFDFNFYFQSLFMANILQRPDSKYWIATFTDSLGRQLKRSTKLLAKKETKKEAMALADRFESAAKNQMTVKQAQVVIGDLMAAQGKALPGMSVRAWVKRWTARQEMQVKLATHRFYEATGRKWVEWLGARADDPIAGQTVQSIMEYRDAMAATLSVYSTNHRMVCVGMILRAARLERLIDENPCDFIKPLKEDREDEVKVAKEPFTVEQIKAILAVADPEWQSMVMWAAYTGQRLADVAMLRWDKLDMPGRKVSLKTRKTGRYQNLPLADPLFEHLFVWVDGKDERKEKYGEELAAYVHPRAAGHISRTSLSGRLSNEFSEILVKAGIRPAEAVARRKSTGKGRDAKRARHALTFHSLRHTATSWMKAAGIPASVVMDFIGHDDAAMSQLYTHTGDEALRKAADSLPRLS